MTAPLNRPPSQNFLDRFGVYDETHYGGGGSLHIYLEDGNIEDGHLRFCRDFARDHGDPEGAWLAQQILFLSRTQRKKLRRGGYQQYRVHEVLKQAQALLKEQTNVE